MQYHLTEAAFLGLVDEVLTAEGRGGLPPDSPVRQIITVYPSDRVLQVLAGPGSGKTEALTWRVLYEVLVNGTPSKNIMVTTFTKRAALELQVRLVERSDTLLHHAHSNGLPVPDPQVHDLRVGTLHSLCDSLLAEYDHEYLESGTQLIDEHECLVRVARSHAFGFVQPTSKIVDQLVAVAPLSSLFLPPWVDASTNHFSSAMSRARWVLDVIGQLTETWMPRRTPNAVVGVESVHGPSGLTTSLEELLSRWHKYLDANRILDFRTIQKQFADRQAQIYDHLSHVFVDEFQDNNPIQFHIHTGWLNNPRIRLTVVGDDDQAIYRFRGSDAECFSQLQPHCIARDISYRLGLLETNYRSTKTIVAFTRLFRDGSALATQSMPKNLVPGPSAPEGVSVRLIRGPWNDVCQVVADELDHLKVGRIPSDTNLPPSAAILMFSTSEATSTNWVPPAVGIRDAIESRGLRLYNPRNKMAASGESEVGMLLGLLSYLVDPISVAPVGKGGRQVEVWASNSDPHKSQAALAEPFGRPINQGHIRFQKWFRKAGGRNLSQCPQDRQQVLTFVDKVRDNLVAAHSKGENVRMSVAGLVARLLALPFFRGSGFTVHMFRQALFTHLLEANIAPTRLSAGSLDEPMIVSRNSNGRYEWEQRYWWMLNYFGAFLDSSSLDDLEIEAFEEHAIPAITFHQAKGLEFDHVYVGATGRDPDFGPALRTRLFSGDPVPYQYVNGLATTDPRTNAMALGDRDREVYVALTRAKESLTILDDTEGTRFMKTHPLLESMFSKCTPTAHDTYPNVQIQEWVNG